MEETTKLNIVFIFTVGFAFASLLGYFSQKIKLSPLLGYLIAGYLIGPFSPGFVADLKLAEQLAEIGVILMMFGVGIHFKWQDLVKVRKIAIPGAIIQTFAATVFGALFIVSSGWTLEAGILMGMAMGVASTVVLVRVLSDYNLLKTAKGHIAVGWLVVEDIITVIALLLLPILGATLKTESVPFNEILHAVGIAFFKFVILITVIFTFGKKIVQFIFNKILQTESHELFTLTILAITFVIAAGAAFLFGTSLALGAFLAGMLIGQTDIRHKVSNTVLSLKDVFVVIFFLSIGMLFNPITLVNHFFLFLMMLGVVIIIKPLAAIFLTWIFKYPFQTGLTVAIGLAQIGEFSFILAEEANKLSLLPDDGYDIIVACSLISIAINPLLFKLFIKNHEKPDPSA